MIECAHERGFFEGGDTLRFAFLLNGDVLETELIHSGRGQQRSFHVCHKSLQGELESQFAIRVDRRGLVAIDPDGREGSLQRLRVEHS